MNLARPTRTLIRHADGILTGLTGSAARAQGDIAIEDGKITSIGRIDARDRDVVIDATGCVIYPGLISTHHHLSQSVLKGVPAGLNAELAEWLLQVPYGFWRKIDEHSFRIAVEIGMIELLLSGVTTIADHHYIFDPSLAYDPAEILFATAARLGPRFVLCRGGATRNTRSDSTGIMQIPAESCDEMLSSAAALVARYHDPTPAAMRRIALAPTNLIWSVGPDDIRVLAAGARSLGIRLHSHLSEAPGDVLQCLQAHGMRPVEYVGQHGFLGEDVWLAHLIHVDQRELEILADTGTAMAHCPQSNCRLGAGIAPAPRMAALGGRISLGVDGAGSNESCDMVSEMHTAWQIHRAICGPQAVTVEDVVSWATAGGATALGIPNTGTIAPGMQADLAIFELSHLRYAGLHDRVAGPLMCGGSPQVRHLLVGGRQIIRDGSILGTNDADLAKIAAHVVKNLSTPMVSPSPP